MGMKIHIFLLALLLVVIPIKSISAKTFGAQTFTLDNGMQVVVIPNHRAPIVTHMLWVKVGGADNLPSQSGMAHYFEHLMFKGTPTIPAGEYSKTIKTLGGNENAFTGADFTAYFESVAVTNLPKVMEMQADRFQNLAPLDADFKSEKMVVLEERRQRTENDPRALFSEQMDAALFINHPYGTPVIGWMDEIKNYEWSDVKKYYDNWYSPNNMILIVSGDITADKLKPLAHKYYGSLPKKELLPRVRPNVPPMFGDTVLTMNHKQIHQPLFYKTYIAPNESEFRKDSLSLQVLSQILDGGPTARLYKRLIVEQKKAINISFSYNANALDYGTISLFATPADGVDVKDMDTLIEQEIRDVIENGVLESEIRDAIQQLQDQAIFARDSVAGPAMIFGYVLTTGGTIDGIENWPNDIATITADDVQKAAKKYLDKNSPWVRAPITGYLLPEQKIEGAEKNVRK